MLNKLLGLLSKNNAKAIVSPDHLANFDPTYKHLKRGNTYVISKQFQDYDSKIHHVGTVIRFLGYNFFPYDAGLTLLFSEGASEYVIRLRLDQEDIQSEINEKIEQYIGMHNE